jgi:hypothetical protein
MHVRAVTRINSVAKYLNANSARHIMVSGNSVNNGCVNVASLLLGSNELVRSNVDARTFIGGFVPEIDPTSHRSDRDPTMLYRFLRRGEIGSFG